MRKALQICLLLMMPLLIMAQSGGAPQFNLNSDIPTDPAVRTGVLANGMKYYIRKNKTPEKRAELRLAVNAGSILENDKQRGLAHFVEHMAFNGTENFKKSELIDYLESVGTKFGAHLNAYTSFDETVYMIQLPTDDKEIVDKGFLILKDWAGGVSFEDEEIDKERGVVIEEWRLGQGAMTRMQDKLFEVMFAGSQYSERLPIGKKEILENFEYQTLKDFYNTWYRPDLMSVVAVGDFEDLDKIESQIKNTFGSLENPKKEEERTIFPVEDYEGTKVVVATDKEAPFTLVMMMHNHDLERERTVKDYREYLVTELMTGMLNQRLSELQNSANPPFMMAQTGFGSNTRSKAAYSSFAMTQPTNIEHCIKTLARENERVKLHGFLKSELDRQKEKMLKNLERGYKEKDQMESGDLAMEYVRNFLEEEPYPGIENELKLAQQFLEEITIEEVNQRAKELITEGNNGIVLMAPEKEDLKVPSEEEVKSILKATKAEKIEPYSDEVDDSPLLAKKPAPGKVASSKTFDKIGVTEWTLANGAKVVLKPTDFKDDEIHLRAFSPGGHSKLSEEDYFKTLMAGSIVRESGVSKFSKNQLQKKFSSKKINLAPYISEKFEHFRGETSPEDLETFLQMIYLYSTNPRKDQEAFDAFIQKQKGFMATLSQTPENIYQDSVRAVLGGHHPRREPVTEAVMDKIELDKSWNFFYDRFSDFSDFTFVFVGNFDPEEIKPLIETYIGGAPGFERQESWKELEIEGPKKTTDVFVKKGMEPKSLVTLTFKGKTRYSYEEEFKMKATAHVLRIMLREALREDMGGTYFVRSNAEMNNIGEDSYKMTIGWGCSPENIEPLFESAMNQIKTLQKSGASETNLQKVKETMRRERETDLKENSFWINTLNDAYMEGRSPEEMLKLNEHLESLTAKDIKKTAKKYYNTKNYVRVSLVPETN